MCLPCLHLRADRKRVPMRLVVLHHLLRLVLIWGFYLAIAQHFYFLLQFRELFVAIIDAREFRL